MMENNRIIGLLGDLGVAEAEAKAYSKLTVRGAVAAVEIADLAGIARPRIYDILKNLETKGLVYVQEGKPTTYLPTPPEKLFELARKKHEKEKKKKIHASREISRIIEPMYRRGILPRELAYMIKDDKNIKETFINRMNAAKRASIVATHDSSQVIANKDGKLRLNARLRIIAEKQKQHIEGVEFKEYPINTGIGLVVIDEKECMILSENNGRYDRCLYITNQTIAAGFEQIFDLVWKSI